jgi:hypothetical protein
MPLVIVGEGTQTKPIFVDPVLPSAVLVPNRRETLEALALIEKLAKQQKVDAPIAFATLRRFILSR